MMEFINENKKMRDRLQNSIKYVRKSCGLAEISNKKIVFIIFFKGCNFQVK